MTPELLGALIERWEAREARENYRTATICATIVNCVLQPKEPCKAEDFMPAPVAAAKEQTPKQQMAMLRCLNAAFGGRVVAR